MRALPELQLLWGPHLEKRYGWYLVFKLSVSFRAGDPLVTVYDKKRLFVFGINPWYNLFSQMSLEVYMVNIGNDWDDILRDDFLSPHYQNLRAFLKEEYSAHTVYPNMFDIFNALRYTPYSEVKAVIIGQDPYHGPNQAHGLSFSVKEGVAPPPSLQNIYKEIHSDLGLPIPNHGCLEKWAKQGVLLLNAVLTVREGQANSHKGKGWEQITDSIIEHLNRREKPIVFLLWGANAGAKRALITNPNHLILRAAHPSPLSAYNGFFGCRHFSKTNAFLASRGIKEIDWRL